MWKKILMFFFGGKNNPKNELEKFVENNNKNNKSQPLPAGTGRSSIDNNSIYYNTDAPLVPEFSLQWLNVLNQLSVFHYDVGQAVTNLIDIANTDFEVYFDDNVSDSQAKKMNLYINQQRKKIFGSAGEKVFINNLIRQIAVYGALSAERVPNNDLRSIKEIVTVCPEEIRFILKDGLYLPHQVVNVIVNVTPIKGNLNPLNTTTYKYQPLLQASRTPYGIPPFLTALEMIGIEKSMIANFSSIAEKLGMFGFLEVLLTAPEQLEDESLDDYVVRCERYRDMIAPKIKESLGQGYVVGFEGSHKFNLAGGNTNAANAEKMLQMVDLMKMSGLKQNPNLLGRQISVTETFGTVLLKLFIAQAKQYQNIVSSFLANTFLLDLRLAGFLLNDVIIEFKEAIPQDEQKKEQTRNTKIQNVFALVDKGIISIQQAAKELGYDKPFVTETKNTNETKPKTNENRYSTKSMTENYVSLLNKIVTQFNYDLPKQCASFVVWDDQKTQDLSDSYIKTITNLFKKSVKKLVGLAIGEIKKIDTKKMSEDKFVNVCLTSIYGNWENEFSEKIKTKTKTNNNKMYDYFRNDKSIFPKKEKEQSQEQSQSFSNPPNVVLDITDTRTINFMIEHDNLYLGQFITDSDTRKRINNFIREFYIEQGENIGENEKVLNEFRSRFTETILLESWKIERILNTSVNKIRTFANINYMHQANVKKYKIVEVMDRITCPHCKAMDGRIFQTKLAREKIEKVVNGSVENSVNISPFATTIDASVLENMSDKELQSQNIDTTPFHPNCRGRVVAEF
jgi:SPP1 gp7 family putative phage head morphogenesis protein